MDDVEFFKVLAVDKLPVGQGRVVRAGLKKVAVFNREGTIYAIENVCPHAGGSLGRGEFSNGVVRCPRHSWGFDVATGQCRTNPRYETTCYPTRLADGYILVGLPDDDTLL